MFIGGWIDIHNDIIYERMFFHNTVCIDISNCDIDLSINEELQAVRWGMLFFNKFYFSSILQNNFWHT